MNAKEIIKQLEKEWDQEYFEYRELSCYNKEDLWLDLGEIKEIYNEREGSDHDTMVVVYHFVDHDIYIHASWYYSSWDWVEFQSSSLCEVFPTEITKTIYVEKKETE